MTKQKLQQGRDCVADDQVLDDIRQDRSLPHELLLHLLELPPPSCPIRVRPHQVDQSRPKNKGRDNLYKSDGSP